MSKADEKKLEQMLKDFETTNPDAGKNFRTLLNDTPALKANLLEAIGKGNLERIEAMPAGLAAKTPGGYASQATVVDGVPVKANTILISTVGLEAAGKNTKDANDMRMILTHESEHAVNKQAIIKADAEFEKKLIAVSKGPSPHDYTPVLKEKADSDRLREATDQVGGFNAVAAHVRKENPTATKEQMYKLLHDSCPEMEHYFKVGGTPSKPTYEPKDGLKLDNNGQLAETPKNIEAMAQHFYDKRPIYLENYGLSALQKAINIEAKEQIADAKADPKYTPPEVRVNLNALGLDKLGVAFPPGSGLTDTSPKVTPFMQQDANMPMSLPNHGVRETSTGDKHIDDLINAKSTKELTAALDRLHESPDGQQFRQQGQAQFQQQEAQKSQEAAKPLPTQEAPTQETPARKVGGM